MAGNYLSKSGKDISVFIILIVVMLFISLTSATHIFTSASSVETLGANIWTANLSEDTFTFNISVSGTHSIDQINISVPSNFSGGLNYTLNFSTLNTTDSDWNCFNETLDTVVSHIICNTTSSYLTSINVTFNATAENITDSYQNWTIITRDTNSDTNSTIIQTIIGAVPDVFSFNPSDDGWTKASVETFKLNISELNLDNSSVMLYYQQVDGGSWASSTTYSCLNYTQQNYYCYISADFGPWSDRVDIAFYFYANDTYNIYSYKGTPSSPYMIHVDRVAPQITPTQPVNGSWYNETFQFSASVTDTGISEIDFVYITMYNSTHDQVAHNSTDDNITNSTGVYTYTFTDATVFDEGLYTMSTGANDTLGNINTDTDFAYGIDYTYPNQTDLVSPPKATPIDIYSGTIQLNATVFDNVSGIAYVEFYLNSNLLGQETISGISTPGVLSNWSYDFDTSVCTDNVTYNLSATAFDQAGNSNYSSNVSIIIDNKPPDIIIYSPPATSIVSSITEINFSVNESPAGVNLSSITLVIDNDATTYFDYTSNCTDVSAGNSYFYNCSYACDTNNVNDSSSTITISASSRSGVTATPTQVTVDVQNSPQVVLSAPGDNAYVNLYDNITYSFTVTDNNATNLTCNLSVSDISGASEYYLNVLNENPDPSNFSGNYSKVINMSLTGDITWYVSCIDQNGNIGYSGSTSGGGYVPQTVFVVNPDIDNSIQNLILTPSVASSYYVASFYTASDLYLEHLLSYNKVYSESTDLIAYSTRSNDTQMVTFTNFNDSTLISTIETLLPDYIYIILSPDKITPDVVWDINNRLSTTINSDSYIDASWSIITARTGANLADYLINKSLTLSWDNSSSIAPANSDPTYSCTASAISNYLASSSASHITTSNYYIGSQATFANLPNIYTDSDFLYICGKGDTNIAWDSNDTDTSEAQNIKSCPYLDGSSESPYYTFCDGQDSSTDLGIGLNDHNEDALFISDISFSARLTGTSSFTTWNPQNPDTTHSDSLALSLFDTTKTSSQREGISAFLGHLMTRWSATEHYTKIFTNTILQGHNLADSFSTLLNSIRLNRFNETHTDTTQSFLDNIASDYVLYASPKMDPTAGSALFSFDTQLTQVSQTPSTDSLIYWSAEVTVTTAKTIPALYDSDGWHSSYASLWITNVSSPADDKINITFASALYGMYSPDPTASNIEIRSSGSSSDTIYSFTVESSEDNNTFVSSSSSALENFRIAPTQNNMIFAYLFSPNSTLSLGTSKTVTINFTTKAVTLNMSSAVAARKINYTTHIDDMDSAGNLTFDITLNNPSDLTISAIRVSKPIPSNAYSCSLQDSLGNPVSFTIIGSDLVFSVSSLPPGDTTYSLNYHTNFTLDNTLKHGNTAYILPSYSFNRGYLVNITGSFSSNESSQDYDIFSEISNSAGSLLWSSSILNQTGSASFDSMGWTVLTNRDDLPDGIYHLKNYITESESNRYVAKRSFWFNITSDFIGYSTISPASVSSDALSGYYPRDSYTINISGSLKNQQRENVSSADVNIISSWESKELITSSVGMFSTNLTLLTSLGEKLFNVTMSDNNNNTVTREHTVNITDYLNYIMIDYDGSYNENSFITKGDTVEIKVTLHNSSSSYVYAGRTTITIDSTLFAENITDTDGKFVADYTHRRNTDDLDVLITAYSPLNISHILTNNSRALKIRYFKTTIDSLPDQQVSSNSNLDMDLNITGTVKFNYDEAHDVANLATVKCYIDSAPLNLTTMTPNVTTTASSLEYTCPVTINATGTYYVRVETEKTSINLTGGTSGTTKTVKGYEQTDFRVYVPSTDDSSSSSSSVYVPSFEEIVNTSNSTVAKTKDFDVAFQKTIYMYPDSVSIFEFTIKNSNNTDFYNLTLDFTGLPNGVTYNSTIIDHLEMDDVGKIYSTFSTPISISMDNYEISGAFKAEESCSSKIKFTLSILPTEKELNNTKKDLVIQNLLYENYTKIFEEFTDLVEGQNMIQRYFSGVNSSVIEEIQTDLEKAKILLENAQMKFDNGDIKSAYADHLAAKELLQKISQKIDENKTSISKGYSYVIYTIIILIVFAAFVWVLIYLLLPDKKYTPKDVFISSPISVKFSDHLKTIKRKLFEKKQKFNFDFDKKEKTDKKDKQKTNPEFKDVEKGFSDLAKK